MPEALPYADILVIALIAVFILLRLRNTLGRHDDLPMQRKDMPPAQEGIERIVKIGERPKPAQEEQARAKQEQEDAALCDTDALPGIKAIRAADAQFSVSAFIEGARSAFEMAFEAFSKSDKETLRMLLAPDVFATFEDAIKRRDEETNKTETTLVAIESARIESATLDGLKARIGMSLVSEQVTVVRDKDGRIIEGNPTQTHRVEDHWVFEREITSRNPNWKIIDT